MNKLSSSRKGAVMFRSYPKKWVAGRGGSLRSVNVLYKERVKDIFFKTSGLDNSFPSGHTIITWTAASTVAHEYPKPWVEWLPYRTAAPPFVARFTSLQHFPSECSSGKHTWVLDRTPHLPCSLQGSSQCGMQCEIVRGNTLSSSRKHEVPDV